MPGPCTKRQSRAAFAVLVPLTAFHPSLLISDPCQTQSQQKDERERRKLIKNPVQATAWTHCLTAREIPGRTGAAGTMSPFPQISLEAPSIAPPSPSTAIPSTAVAVKESLDTRPPPAPWSPAPECDLCWRANIPQGAPLPSAHLAGGSAKTAVGENVSHCNRGKNPARSNRAEVLGRRRSAATAAPLFAASPRCCHHPRAESTCGAC